MALLLRWKRLPFSREPLASSLAEEFPFDRISAIRGKTGVSAASLSVVFEAEACIAGIVSTELSLSISQQDCSDVRVAFPTEGGFRTVRHNQGQLDTGAMSTLGTKSKFTGAGAGDRYRRQNRHCAYVYSNRLSSSPRKSSRRAV